MRRTLSELERKNLIATHKKERDGRICDRIKAVLLRDDGYSYSEIAKKQLNAFSTRAALSGNIAAAALASALFILTIVKALSL